MRLAGESAADTSARIATEAFPEGSEWVVIARDDDFADAMSATGLAGVLNAPIVLTDRYSLSDAAARAVQTLGAKKAYIIGGTGAIPGDIEGSLATFGCQTQDAYSGMIAGILLPNAQRKSPSTAAIQTATQLWLCPQISRTHCP